MPDIWTTKSNMTCHTFEYQNQTWSARNSNNRIKHDVPDIPTTKSNILCQTFEQQNQTWRIRHSNNKIKHGVPEVERSKSNMACKTFEQIYIINERKSDLTDNDRSVKRANQKGFANCKIGKSENRALWIWVKYKKSKPQLLVLTKKSVYVLNEKGCIQNDLGH